MTVLITYDVSTLTSEGRRRLRQIAQACKDYGQRVQYSVFECSVNDTKWAVLRHRLLEIMEYQEDSLRFYILGEDDLKRIEHHGVRPPIDLDGPLIV